MSIPSPKERPDLYDDFDCRPSNGKSPVSVPPSVQKMIDERESAAKVPQEEAVAQ